MVEKRHHGFFKLVLFHLSVSNGNAEVTQKRSEFVMQAVDTLYPVM